MYRSAAVRRLLPALCRRNTINYRCSTPIFQFPARVTNPTQAPFSTSAPLGNSVDQNPNNFGSPPSSSSSSSSSAGSEQERLGDNRSRMGRGTSSPKAHWQEEQARVLHASLGHVVKLGWSDAAMIAGAREAGVSPSIVGSFPRKEAALVEYFMDDCLQRLIDIVDTKEDLKDLIPSQRVAKIVKIRLEMQAPYISKWPQALSIQAQPSNISASFTQRAMLVDEIWHASGDEATDAEWYTKRVVLGAIYSATELYMLTDNSPDFHDTWAFMEERIQDAFDLKKTALELKYLAEAVGAGMGGPVQEILKRFFKG